MTIDSKDIDTSIDQTQERERTKVPASTHSRRRAMFFEKVGGGKEIPFGKTLVLYRKHNGEDYFTTGLLTAQIKTVNGFKYEFSDDTLREVDTPQSFEYYLVPQIS